MRVMLGGVRREGVLGGKSSQIHHGPLQPRSTAGVSVVKDLEESLLMMRLVFDETTKIIRWEGSTI